MIALPLALAAIAASAVVDEAPARVVIVVGYDGDEPDAHDGGRPRLAYADDDAARAYLTALPESDRAFLLTTFDGDSARLFPELTTLARAPTKDELAHVLGEAFWRLRALKDSGRSTELVFIFAGHGDVSASGEGFLVLQGGTLTRTELTAQVVRGSPADVNHVLIDACASYFMVSSRGGAEATAPSVPLSPQLLDVLRNRDDSAAWDRTGVLVSTSDSAAVHESGALGAGVFSFLLRSALLGAADVDGDGRVEYAEAAGFIAAASADVDDPRARLRVFARAPAQRPHAALADAHRGEARRFLAVDVKGVERLRLLDEHGLPVAEVHRSENKDGTPLLLALAGSAFYVVEVGGKEATLVPRSAGAYALSSLHFTDGAGAARGRDASAFSTLFATAWGRAFFDGWVTTSTLPRPLTGPVVEVAWAEDAAPAFRPPWSAVSTGAFVGAGIFAAVSAGAAAMNLTSFATLQQSYERTSTIDAEQALQVEAWRTTATVSGAVALASALVGAGCYALASDEEAR